MFLCACWQIMQLYWAWCPFADYHFIFLSIFWGLKSFQLFFHLHFTSWTNQISFFPLIYYTVLWKRFGVDDFIHINGTNGRFTYISGKFGTQMGQLLFDHSKHHMLIRMCFYTWITFLFLWICNSALLGIPSFYVTNYIFPL